MKALYVQMIDLKFLFQYLEVRCHGNQIICERQVQHGQKTGVFCQIFPDILDLFSQSFHRTKALYVHMMRCTQNKFTIFFIGLFLLLSWVGSGQENRGSGRVGSQKSDPCPTLRQVQHGQKTGVFCQIFPDILDLFSQSFHRMKPLFSLCTFDGSVLFSKFGQLASSNLGVYAIKKCNFCRHAPAILAFRNGLEDRNFDFSRVIGKHFCTPCRNLVRFGSVTPEFKT